MKKQNDYPWFKSYGDIKPSFDLPNVSMYEMVRRSANKYPSLIAYSYYGTKITYKSYLRKIDEAAIAFSKLGAKKGDYVSIIMPNTPEAIICFYALNKLGCIANMLHPLSGEEELKFGINLTKTKFILVSDVSYDKVANIKDEINCEKIIYVSVSESMDPLMKLAYRFKQGKGLQVFPADVIPYHRFIAKGKFTRSRVKDNNKGSDTAAILYSGGTTGKPKGIVLTNSNFNYLATGLLEVNKVMGPGISTLSIMPIFHGFGLGCTTHAVHISGGQTIILPTVNPKKFDQTVLKYKPNTIGCVPSLLQTLINSRKLAKADLSFIKCIVCGGDSISEKLDGELDKFLFEHGSDAKVRGAFGMTECSAGCTMMPKHKKKLGSVGVPIPNCYIKIVNPETDEELPYGETGEICISGPTLMKEYLNEKEETENILRKGKDGKLWLHSGDLGYMDEDGYIFFKARLKRMIVSSGYNIYPGQIEQIILEHPYVEQCIVVGVPHPYKKEVVKAYIVLKKGLVLNSEIKKSIKTHCEKNIAKYALPYAYGYRKELPKTLLGKVAYKELIKDSEEDK